MCFFKGGLFFFIKKNIFSWTPNQIVKYYLHMFCEEKFLYIWDQVTCVKNRNLVEGLVGSQEGVKIHKIKNLNIWSQNVYELYEFNKMTKKLK